MIDDIILKAIDSYNTKNYNDCISYSLEALQLDAKHEDPICLLALSYHYLSEFQTSLKYFKLCNRRIKADCETWQLYAQTLAMNNEMEESIRQYKKAIVKYPSSAVLYYNLGYTLIANDQYQAGIDAYEKAAELDPTIVDSNFHFHIGVAYYNTEDYRMAEDQLQTALELNEENEEAAFLMGEIYFNYNDHENAINYFSRVLYYNPQHKKALFHRLISRVNIKDENGFIINREAAQADADAVFPFIGEFINLNDKDGKKMVAAALTISDVGGFEFDAS
jgi:tetratricopeptide (TPR) repeat protein